MANPKRQPTELELAYIAGIIDGEGCISVFESQWEAKRNTYERERDTRYRYKVIVKMVDPDAINLLMDVFGGSICMQQPKARARFPQFAWTVSEKRAAACLKLCLPYLRIKKHRAELLLQLSDLISKCSRRGRGYHVPEQEKESRRELIQVIKNENQRTHLQRVIA